MIPWWERTNEIGIVMWWGAWTVNKTCYSQCCPTTPIRGKGVLPSTLGTRIHSSFPSPSTSSICLWSPIHLFSRAWFHTIALGFQCFTPIFEGWARISKSRYACEWVEVSTCIRVVPPTTQAWKFPCFRIKVSCSHVWCYTRPNYPPFIRSSGIQVLLFSSSFSAGTMPKNYSFYTAGVCRSCLTDGVKEPWTRLFNGFGRLE